MGGDAAWGGMRRALLSSAVSDGFQDTACGAPLEGHSGGDGSWVHPSPITLPTKQPVLLGKTAAHFGGAAFGSPCPEKGFSDSARGSKDPSDKSEGLARASHPHQCHCQMPRMPASWVPKPLCPPLRTLSTHSHNTARAS